MSGDATPSEIRLGPWRVRPALREIEGPRSTIRVKPKSMEVLLALLERPGDVHSREELLARVWKDTAVTDEVLTQSVAQLRRASEAIPRRRTSSRPCHAPDIDC